MKIRNIVVAALSVLVLASCGETKKELELCDCIELELKAMKEVGMDEAKMESFETENKESIDACEALSKTLNEEMEALSEEEQETKRTELMETCPAISEIQKLYEDMQAQYMEEAMKNVDPSQLQGLEGGIENALEGLENAEETAVDVLEQAGETIEGLK